MTTLIALTGWFSFTDGEATAGDLLALAAAREELEGAALPYEVFWSPGFRPAGSSLDRLPAAPPHSHMVFVCGPLHGPQVERLHRLFPDAERIAVGVSVPDPDAPAATGFHRVLARDAPGTPPRPDLALRAPRRPHPPVAAVVLTGGQGEYGGRRRHDDVAGSVARLLAERDAAVLPWDTRLSTSEWHLPSTAEQFEAVLARTDLVVTDRLHGLVIGLRVGVPVLALDPVAGGAKVLAQARALDWPAVLCPDELDGPSFDRWWDWCLGPGRALARHRATPRPASAPSLLPLLRPAP